MQEKTLELARDLANHIATSQLAAKRKATLASLSNSAEAMALWRQYVALLDITPALNSR